MEYHEFNQPFKNLLNRVMGMMKAYEPTNVEIATKTILNVFKDEYKIEELSHYSKYADKVLNFLFYAKFIERSDHQNHVLTDKGIKVKEYSSFEKYYEWEKGKKDLEKNIVLTPNNISVDEKVIHNLIDEIISKFINTAEKIENQFDFDDSINALINAIFERFRDRYLNIKDSEKYKTIFLNGVRFKQDELIHSVGFINVLTDVIEIDGNSDKNQPYFESILLFCNRRKRSDFRDVVRYLIKLKSLLAVFHKINGYYLPDQKISDNFSQPQINELTPAPKITKTMTNEQKNAVLKLLIDREDEGTIDGDDIAQELGLRANHVMDLIEDFRGKEYIDFIGMAGRNFQVTLLLKGVEFYQKGGYVKTNNNLKLDIDLKDVKLILNTLLNREQMFFIEDDEFLAANNFTLGYAERILDFIKQAKPEFISFARTWNGLTAIAIDKKRNEIRAYIESDFFDTDNREHSKPSGEFLTNRTNPISKFKSKAHYHIILELMYFVSIPGGHKSLYVFDLTDLEDIEENIVAPYIQNHTFIINGRSIEKEMVETLTIMESLNKTNEYLEIARKKNPSIISSNSDIIRDTEYFKDITGKVFNRVQQSIRRNLNTNVTSDTLIHSGTTKRNYQIGLSFAGEDRAYVEQVADELKKMSVSVFYDDYEKLNLWGKDLYQHLNGIYKNECEYCIIFISGHYAKKLWTIHELKSAQAKAFTENKEYILPVRFDKTELPGLNSTVGYLDCNKISPIELAKLAAQKVGMLRET